MWIKSLVIVCILGIISSLSAVDTTGFRDMKWGDSPKALGSQAVLSSEDKVKKISIYTRKDENLIIGDVKLQHIRYEFFDNKLYRITIDTLTTGDEKGNMMIVDQLMETFVSKYGKYSHKDGDSYAWVTGGNTMIIIAGKLGLATIMGVMARFTYNKISQEAADYLKQKSVNDL